MKHKSTIGSKTGQFQGMISCDLILISGSLEGTGSSKQKYQMIAMAEV